MVPAGPPRPDAHLDCLTYFEPTVFGLPLQLLAGIRARVHLLLSTLR